MKFQLRRVLYVPGAPLAAQGRRADRPAPPRRDAGARARRAGRTGRSTSRSSTASRPPTRSTRCARSRPAIPGDELWLLMGTDMLAGFERWREPEEILRLARIAAFEREPFAGDRASGCPTSPGLADRLSVFDAGSVKISATELRNDLAARQERRGQGSGAGRGVHYEARSLQTRGCRSVEARPLRPRTRSGKVSTAALDRKAAAVLVFNLTELTTMADYFVLSTASSDRQARAIADAIAERLGPAALGRGLADGQLDPDGLRRRRVPRLPGGGAAFYALERLWGDAPNETGVVWRRPTPRREPACLRRPLDAAGRE